MRERDNTELTSKREKEIVIAIEKFYEHIVSNQIRFSVDYMLHTDVKRMDTTTAPFQLLQLIAGFVLGVLLFVVLSPVLPWDRSLPKCQSLFPSICSGSITESSSFHGRVSTRRSDPKAKELLFIGVMTSKKYADTRIPSLYSAWGKYVPGKLKVFSAGNQPDRPGSPIVALPGVDDEYPPQKKSFTMIKFMYDNHLDDYEWFVRADDDVFFEVRTLRVAAMLVVFMLSRSL